MERLSLYNHREEKLTKHCSSSSHKILLVGEGGLSFAVSLTLCTTISSWFYELVISNWFSKPIISDDISKIQVV
jgi:hypothetical protein